MVQNFHAMLGQQALTHSISSHEISIEPRVQSRAEELIHLELVDLGAAVVATFIVVTLGSESLALSILGARALVS